MTVRMLEERIDELESRSAIEGLVATYCEALDHRDLAKFLALWHEDGYFSIDGRGEYRGVDGLTRSQAGVAKAWSRTWHWTTNLTVAFQDADRATGRSDVFGVLEHHDGAGTCLVAGTYVDSYERREGTWRFATRSITRWFETPAQDIPLPPPS